MVSSVLFSCSVVSDSLQPHGLQHAYMDRPRCPMPTPGVYSKSCPLSRWCHQTILYRPPFPSIRVFSNKSVLHISWPKYWSFSFSISPSNEYPGLISFRMDWLDLLAVQRALKSLLQHHSSKASILKHSAFFIVHLSQLYITTRKNIALTRLDFVDKVVSLLFNRLSRLVITFLPRTKRLLISWLQSPSALILEPRKQKQKQKRLSLFPLFPQLFAMKWWHQMPWSYFSECWVLGQFFHSPLDYKYHLIPFKESFIICICCILLFCSIQHTYLFYFFVAFQSICNWDLLLSFFFNYFIFLTLRYCIGFCHI